MGLFWADLFELRLLEARILWQQKLITFLGTVCALEAPDGRNLIFVTIKILVEA
jgi:hypothetical protein